MSDQKEKTYKVKLVYKATYEFEVEALSEDEAEQRAIQMTDEAGPNDFTYHEGEVEEVRE